MDANQILVIIIVILVGFILVFGTYFIYTTIYNKRHKKKTDTIFDTNNLVEEESLMNVMDEKRNFDFKNETENEKFTFVDDTPVETATSEVMKTEEQINPFDVDMTKKTRDNVDYVKEEETRTSNKFFN